MASTFYLVSISTLTGPTNGDGFINNLSTQRYMAIDGSVPSSVTISEGNARGNIRYNSMIAQLQLMANLYVSNAVGTGATANVTPTAFTFTLESEHGDSVLTTSDELTPGAVLTGNVAIQRCIARAFTQDRNDPSQWYDPTTSNAVINGVSTDPFARNEQITGLMDTGALTNTANSLSSQLTIATAAITVTELSF